jgi:protein SCO1
MKGSAFGILFAAFVASGALFVVMAYRLVASYSDGQAGAAHRGSEIALDAEYQKLPPGADSGALLEGFTLTERSGRPVAWDDLQGKVRVVSFFFSSCPASCLQQNMKTRDLARAYAGQDVVFVAITCDPDTDSPERLREYATRLEAPQDNWLFLTGRLAYIRRVASEIFNVALDKQTHSERFIVCDKAGEIRGRFLWNKLDEMAELRILVDQLLAEKGKNSEVGAQASERVAQ